MKLDRRFLHTKPEGVTTLGEIPEFKAVVESRKNGRHAEAVEREREGRSDERGR